ncbi:hypothetical protein Droror1_Dr00011724 [Drosera rotundifolia]
MIPPTNDSILSKKTYAMMVKDDAKVVDIRMDDAGNPFVDNRDLRRGLKLESVERHDKDLEITLEDVIDERRFWDNALIGYVLGDRFHIQLWRISYRIMLLGALLVRAMNPG